MTHSNIRLLGTIRGIRGIRGKMPAIEIAAETPAATRFSSCFEFETVERIYILSIKDK